VLLALAATIYRFDTPGARINYGADRVRFPAPVLVGARIGSDVALGDVQPITSGLQLTLNPSIEIEHATGQPLIRPSIFLDDYPKMWPLAGLRIALSYKPKARLAEIRSAWPHMRPGFGGLDTRDQDQRLASQPRA
jgi:hypothetical protein